MNRREQQRLTVLLRLAELREQRAAQALGSVNGRLQAAQRHADQLADYQLEYAQRLRDEGATGVSPQALRNHDRFGKSLGNARDQQLANLTEMEAQRDAVRQRWIDQYARRRLLEQLRDRRRLEAEQLANRQLQREQDDRRTMGHEDID